MRNKNMKKALNKTALALLASLTLSLSANAGIKKFRKNIVTMIKPKRLKFSTLPQSSPSWYRIWCLPLMISISIIRT